MYTNKHTQTHKVSTIHKQNDVYGDIFFLCVWEKKKNTHQEYRHLWYNFTLENGKQLKLNHRFNLYFRMVSQCCSYTLSFTFHPTNPMRQIYTEHTQTWERFIWNVCLLSKLLNYHAQEETVEERILSRGLNCAWAGVGQCYVVWITLTHCLCTVKQFSSGHVLMTYRLVILILHLHPFQVDCFSVVHPYITEFMDMSSD